MSGPPVRPTRVVTVVPTFALLVATAWVPASQGMLAQESEQEYRVGPVEVTLEVDGEGNYHLRENIRWDFRSGTFTTLFREFDPYEFDRMSDPQVRTDDGTELELVEDDWDEGEREVHWRFPERSQPLTTDIRYTLTRALETTAETNRLRWRALGSAWDVPRGPVRFEVTLPGHFLSGSDELQAEPLPDRITGSPESGWSVVWSREELTGGSDLRVRLTFPKVVEAAPVGLYDPVARNILVGGALLLLSLMAGVGLQLAWRGPKIPSGRSVGRVPMGVLERAVLIHGTGGEGERGFGSLLIRAAQAGRYRFVFEKDEDRLGKPKRVRLERVSPDEVGPDGEEASLSFDGEELPLELLERLEAEIDRYEDLGRFASKGRRFRRDWLREVRDRLVEEGLLEDRSARSKSTSIVGVAVLVLGTAAAILLGLYVFVDGFALIGLALGTGMGLLIASGASHPWTLEGARRRQGELDALTRLRESLDRASRADPSRAAQLWVEQLPESILDAQGSQGAVERIRQGLKKNERTRFESPEWVVDRTGDEGRGPEAMRNFQSAREAIGFALQGAAPASGAAAGAGVVIGAAAAGAAGGGGGGGGGGAG